MKRFPTGTLLMLLTVAWSGMAAAASGKAWPALVGGFGAGLWFCLSIMRLRDWWDA